MRCDILFLVIYQLLIHQKVKENIPPTGEDEFPVMKRKAEEVVAERPTKVTKKEDPLARKKVPITTSKVLKDRDVSLNSRVNQFSNSLRSGVSLYETPSHTYNYHPLSFYFSPSPPLHL